MQDLHSFRRSFFFASTSSIRRFKQVLEASESDHRENMAMATSTQGEVPVLLTLLPFSFFTSFELIFFDLWIRYFRLDYIRFGHHYLNIKSTPRSLCFCFSYIPRDLKMYLLLSFLALLLCFANPTSAGFRGHISARAISPDNTCGFNGTGGGADGYTCPQSLPCCSVHGFCGSTNAYCLTTVGCQAAFGNCTAPSPGILTPDETCGITAAGTEGYNCGADSPCCSGK